MTYRARWLGPFALVGAGLLVLSACSGSKTSDEASKQLGAGETATTVAGVTETTVAGTVPTTVAAGGTAAKSTAARTATRTATGAVTGGTTAPGPGFVATILFSPAEDRVGLSKDRMTLCGHAALTYAPAFNTGVDDLNVYWDALNAEKGGVHGRKVVVTYENDDYKPETAVQAASACKAKNPFVLIGGIGFDQIPAVRNWAEQNRMPYIHHTATAKGSEGKQFSYTALPTVEKAGEMFGELIVKRFKDKKIGIIKRGSPNWEPGVEAFKALAKKHNLKIVKEREVANAQGNYTQELLDMKNAEADVVWAWENALAATELIKQAKAQQFNPQWLLFPFNLTSQTLEGDALSPKLEGVAVWPAYSKGDYSGPFAQYADDMKEFERQYAKYRPNVDLGSVAGDLLFLAWSEFKALHILLEQCGPDCGRNKLIDVMRTYKGRPTSSYCDVDFRGTHVGQYQVSLLETYRAASGKVNWRNTNTCVEHL